MENEETRRRRHHKSIVVDTLMLQKTILRQEIKYIARFSDDAADRFLHRKEDLQSEDQTSQIGPETNKVGLLQEESFSR